MNTEQCARKIATRIGADYFHTGSMVTERAIAKQLRGIGRDELAARKPGRRTRFEFSTEAWVRLWAVKPAAERIRK
jgi:hypothetical protein